MRVKEGCFARGLELECIQAVLDCAKGELVIAEAARQRTL